MSQLTVGNTLPELEFEVFHEGKQKNVKLRDYRGKWLILFFYPGDFTFVCPTELEDMAVNYDKFKKEGAEVVSFSVDSVYVHKAWRDQSPAIGKVIFPMGSDQTGKLSKILGVYIEEEGQSRRGSFVIDPSGAIKSIEVNDNSIGRNALELLRKLQAAKYTSEHSGKVCPANWHPGEDTLTKGMDLVGKI